MRRIMKTAWENEAWSSLVIFVLFTNFNII